MWPLVGVKGVAGLRVSECYCESFVISALFSSSWNSEIATILPQYSVQSINKLERIFCEEIKWDLYISSSAYAKYYFALRALTEKKDFRR
jgi:hypothetical protein